MKNMSMVQDAGGAGVPCSVSGGGSRPVDLVHLSRYTMGNRDLEAELLGLFRRQAGVYIGRMQAAANEEEWQRAAHSLKGSAKAVGAWDVASMAQAAEELSVNDDGGRSGAIADIEQRVATVTAYIDALFGA